MKLLPSPQAASTHLKWLLPDIDWAIKYIEARGGWLQLPPRITAIVNRLQLQCYVELYTSPHAIGQAILNAFLEPEEQVTFEAELNAMSAQELSEALSAELVVPDRDFPTVFPKSDEEVLAATRAFELLTAQEKQAAVRQASWLVAAFVATLHNHLSSMVHGIPLTTLVARALQGDDDAFAKAVQIDRSILVGLKYFKERYTQAHLAGDSAFFCSIGGALSRPVLSGRLRYRPLWISFAILDELGLLDGSLTVGAIQKILDDAELDRWQNRIEEEGYLAKRLHEYRQRKAQYSR